MDEVSPSTAIKFDALTLTRELNAYREPRSARSVFELLITAIPFGLLWALSCVALNAGYWIGLILAVPAAGFLIRLFMIQHDCGHGSFFPRRALNDWTGRAIGVLTLTPYEYWRRAHALHHASSGNLDHRGIGDIDTLTVREYLALPRSRQILYRMYRHPLVMFGLGPAYLFVLRHRLPMGLMHSGWRPLGQRDGDERRDRNPGRSDDLAGRRSHIPARAAAHYASRRIGRRLVVLRPAPVREYVLGARRRLDVPGRPRCTAARTMTLPPVLRWFTANIGVHHVHHLSNRIPYYRLPEVLRDHPQLAAIGRLTLLQSFRCVRMVLWDENRRRLISFREMHTCVDD